MDDNSPALDVLLPTTRRGRIPPDPAERDLVELYEHPAGTGDLPWVRANVVATLDGAAAGPDGRSGSINGAADARVFHVLRSLADVVLVGAGTVRTEGYREPRTPPGLKEGRRERGQSEHPGLAVVTRRGDLPPTLLDGDPQPWVFTVSDAPFLGHLRAHLPPDRLHVHDGTVDLAAALRTLADAGCSRVLTEGGPRFLGELVGDGLVDEVCLTQSPLLVGGDAPRVLTAAPWLDPPRAARPAHLLHCDGVLIGRWLLQGN